MAEQATEQRVWRRDGIFSSFFDWVATNERASRIMGRLWNTDINILFSDIAKMKEIAADSTILDVPCGGGVAFRGIPTDRKISYYAVDIAPAQLDRARDEAKKLKLGGIEFVEGDVAKLPYESETFDLCVSYAGLHCFPDPLAALTEIHRVLRPGASLRGSSVVRGGVAAHFLIKAAQRANTMGPAVTHVPQVRKWLVEAGFQDVTIQKSGLLAYFSGRRGD
jgi:ubiquinone/menaquinone biosynthesis C-methylase UbiE